MALAACACAGGGLPPERVLLVVTVDTLRADRLGAYGSALGLTPHLDALAERSAVFTAAYAPSSATLPSIGALLTGLYPETLGVRTNASALPRDVPTLATELRARGWATGAVVSSLVLESGAGLAVGFDVYDQQLPQREAVRKWPERVADETTRAAVRALDRLLERSPQRVFLWVHYQDPHGPYTPPAGLRERYLEAERRAPDGGRELPVQSGDAERGAIPGYQVLGEQREVAFYRAGYDAEVRLVDEAFGHLRAGIAERGLDGRTQIVFTADHGEALGEDDFWFAHEHLLTQPLVRVPLLLYVPGRAAERRDEPAALVDLYPTLLRLAADAETGASYPGRDLLAPGAPQGASLPYLASYANPERPRLALVHGDYRYEIVFADGAGRGRLYRIGDDGEVPLSAPPLEAEMRRALARLRESLGPPRPERTRELGEAEREQLRALGYAIE